MNRLLCFLLSVFLCIPAFSVAPAHEPKPIASGLPITSKSSSQVELELKVLETQNALIKEYHSSLLDTVYWALGTVAAVAALLVGFGWFANFKFHESEKQRLKDELDGRINELQASLENRLSTNEVKVLNSVDMRLDNYLARGARDIDLVRGEVVGTNERISKEIDELKGRLTILDSAMSRSKIADSEIEASLRRIEEYIWELKGIPENILITQTQGLAAAVDAKNKYYVASVLERMGELLEKSFISKNKPMSGRTIDDVDAEVALASEIEPIGVEKVRGLLMKVEKRG